MKSGSILGSAVIEEAFFGRKQAAVGTLFGSVSHSPNREAKLTLATPWTPTATQVFAMLTGTYGTRLVLILHRVSPGRRLESSIFVDEAGCFHLITAFLGHV